MNVRCIEDMHRKNSVKGIDAMDHPSEGKECEHCVKGKMIRSSLRSRTSKASKPGEVIYSDLCGPMPVKSLGGASYFVTFNDECSNFKMTKMLKKKSDTLTAFKEFLPYFERQFECVVKTFYSDHGGEFDAMIDFLNERGIKHECSAPYTPEQNGPAERFNRTLLDMVRSMLTQAQLPPTFWAEAVATATDLRNITASAKNDGMTPMEFLTGLKPDVRHLRIFGSEAWIHVPKNLRKKLHMKARRGIVLRSLSFGKYRIWDIEARRAYDTRHAVINESLFPAFEWRSNYANEAATQKWYSDIRASTEPGDNFLKERTAEVAEQRQETDAGDANGKCADNADAESIISDLPELVEEDVAIE